MLKMAKDVNLEEFFIQAYETIDGKYAAACFRAERVIASFYKDYGKEMTKMAFEHELENIDF